MGLYESASWGKTFPIGGVAPSPAVMPAGIMNGNGNASPPQTDLVAGGATPAAHAMAARSAGILTAAGGVVNHPLFWATVSIQGGFILLAFLARAEARVE